MSCSDDLASIRRATTVVLALTTTITMAPGCAMPLPDVDGGGTGASSSDGSSSDSTSDSPSLDSTGDTQPTDTDIVPECGNGIVEGSEACDDGGESETCTTECTLVEVPDVPVLSLSFSPIKLFDYTWSSVEGAQYYQLLESPRPAEPYVQLGEDIVGESASFEMPLHLRIEASYVLQACNGAGCTSSAEVSVMGSLAEAVGYVKASNTGANDMFGYSVALSSDGNTLAIGTPGEDSSAAGIGGDQANDATIDAGAVYVFVHDGTGAWSQQAYVKASNPDTSDVFGHSVALSSDGNTLAVGAWWEDSYSTLINGDQANDFATDAGAAYVFVRDGMGTWTQQAYIKAGNIEQGDVFGYDVALSGDGNTLAVGAVGEDSSAVGVNHYVDDEAYSGSGAAYVFVRDDMGAWTQQAYVKASNTGESDYFGWSLTLSEDGDTLAVGAVYEDSSATGINDQSNDAASDAGAVYVFVHDGSGGWSQQAYIKASNTDAGDNFGFQLALSSDGSTLAVSSPYEDSSAKGIGNGQTNDGSDVGAVYVFTRNETSWSQQAYVKAAVTDDFDRLGYSLALSGDGNTLVASTTGDDGSATGIGGEPTAGNATDAGAVCVFERTERGEWSQRAYVKASNTEHGDVLGVDVALSGDARTLAASALYEDGGTLGIGRDQANNLTPGSGAVYLY